MTTKAVQTNFLIRDEFSEQLDHFNMQLVNFGYFKQRDKRVIQNDVLNNYKFTIIKSGECVIYNKQQRVHLKAHDAVLVSPFCFYSAEAIGDEPLEFYFIRFTIDNIKISTEFMSFFHLASLNIYNQIADDNTLQKLELAYNDIENNVPGYFFYLENFLRILLLNIMRNVHIKKDSHKYTSQNSNEEKTIIKCIRYIDENITENIKVDDICEHLHVSQSYLYRCFKDIMDTSTKEFLSSYRIRYICSDLEFSTLSIKEIAEKYNFPSAYAFTNSFKTVMNCSPTEYRKTKQK